MIGGRGGGARLGFLLVGVGLACGPGSADPARKDMSAADATTAGEGPPPAEPRDASTICEGRAALADPAVSPVDARLLVALDLDAEALGEALDRVEAWAGDAVSGAPMVAGLALSQLGFQLGLVRASLDEIGVRPSGVLVLQAPGGELVWIVHLRCDLDGLRGLVEARWRLRTRTTVGGMIAEAPADGPFAHDVLVLADDRLALAPRGRGAAVLRWLIGAGPVRSLGAAPASAAVPGEVLAALPAAPVRALVAGEGGGGLVIPGSGWWMLRADGRGLTIGDSLAPP